MHLRHLFLLAALSLAAALPAKEDPKAVLDAAVSKLENSGGVRGQFTITQCSIAEAVPKSASADLVIATTVKPEGIECAFISGIPFLTGIGRPAAEKAVLDFMAKQ